MKYLSGTGLAYFANKLKEGIFKVGDSAKLDGKSADSYYNFDTVINIDDSVDIHTLKGGIYSFEGTVPSDKNYPQEIVGNFNHAIIQVIGRQIFDENGYGAIILTTNWNQVYYKTQSWSTWRDWKRMSNNSDIESIINGTTQVGNAQTLRGYGLGAGYANSLPHTDTNRNTYIGQSLQFFNDGTQKGYIVVNDGGWYDTSLPMACNIVINPSLNVYRPTQILSSTPTALTNGHIAEVIE